ncbi:zf-UBP-domain-containing protein [Westerdykella ornata]|uniref:Zf-UBP-domain-containing protein n=1 Tax=Westerdykella ornata TaxID=318751 RepID=A0A6A6JKW2_WESOR|nr:zf-UBP-domain-containing protein [Westerdykella ornata]KAF2276875.1 zf-UBP-domain-containing protein [Westerdykella ornata]
MPAYFFHITLEIHSPTFAVGSNTDIFRSNLPGHSKNASDAPSESSGAKPVDSSSPSAYHRKGSGPAESSTLVPFPQSPVRKTYRGASNSAAQDWRYDCITIQSIDMPGAGDAKSRSGSKSQKQPSRTPNAGGLATKGSFIPLNVKDTDVGWGVVHLYRDGQETPGLYDDVRASAKDFKEEDCTTLCILAVPSYMTPADFLGFVGEQTREDVSHFRLIKTSRANKYMVLMKFRKAKKARQWRKEWNGRAFNSMESEYCHVVFVKSINFQTTDPKSDTSSYPDLTNDPFTPAPRNQPTAPAPTGASPVESSLASSLTTKPLAPPTPSLVELPTCPVCLERMDETTGLLTILCQHVFHCACLEKWRGSGCPVCRYTQHDAFGARAGESWDPEKEKLCSVCASTENLWICLICGNIGCGRYDSAHAFAHYEETGHSFAMDIVTQHIWDYAGDGYVHRILQHQADGKLVDLPASNSTLRDMDGAAVTGAESVPREKLDNMGMEYAHLLTSQLESQRMYFEEQVQRAVDKAAKAVAAAESAERKVGGLEKELAELKRRHEEATQQMRTLEKESARQEKKAAQAAELARRLTKQVQEERVVNESLMTRIRFLEGRKDEVERENEGLRREKGELEEQNRDLSFFISGRERLREMQGDGGLGLEEEEVKGAYLEVGERGEGVKGRRRGKGKGRK